METKAATEAFAALSQETRLNVFRLLVRLGPEGRPAGEIADEIGVSPSTLSFHLTQLERAGIVTSTRRQRHVWYAANFTGVRGLIDYLVSDCCQGREEICGAAALRSANNQQ